MRIACLYWPSKGVGGINTELRAFHTEAQRRGDTFHVFRSALHKNIAPGLFSERKLIRGGDTFVTIDGEASHHASQLGATLQLLASYDQVYLSYLCPYINKDYGDKPEFLKLLRALHDMGMPIVGRITDGYWKEYAEWGAATLDLCVSATFTHPSAAYNWEGNSKVSHGGMPFCPRQVERKMTPRQGTVWTSQWKALKGIIRLLPELDKINGPVDLYSSGILYYQLRSKPTWARVVGKDLFAPEFSGKGKAVYHGYVPLERVPRILSDALFMVDLMGIGKPKCPTYLTGAHNNTTIEAAWYGACPILHARASSVVPIDIALFASEARDVPRLINSKEGQAFATDPKRQARAQDWVRKNFLVTDLYPRLVLGEQS